MGDDILVLVDLRARAVRGDEAEERPRGVAETLAERRRRMVCVGVSVVRGGVGGGGGREEEEES
jgi:acetyl-CoA carboxylase alpha subunit